MNLIDEVNDGVCWFCSKPAADNFPVAIGMFSPLESLTIKLSRCSKCEYFHNITSRFENAGASIGVAVGVLAGIIAIALMFSRLFSKGVVLISIIIPIIILAAGAVIGTIAGAVIVEILLLPLKAVMKSKGIKGFSHMRTHPTVSMLLKGGWKIDNESLNESKITQLEFN